MERENYICQLTGTVIQGRGLGKLIGMPTANLNVTEAGQLPDRGVYIARVLLDDQIYYGVTHIGLRPTMDDAAKISMETHLLAFHDPLYGKQMQVQLFQKIRETKKFESASALLQQIQRDCQTAQEYWGLSPTNTRLLIERERRQVRLDEKEIYLSEKEFDVLYLLYANPDVLFTKEQIYEAVWHAPANGSYHAVENTVFQIRKRLKAHGVVQDYIKTVVGHGYKYHAE